MISLSWPQTLLCGREVFMTHLVSPPVYITTPRADPEATTVLDHSVFLALWLWGVHDTPGLSPCIYHHPQGGPRGHHSVGPQCLLYTNLALWLWGVHDTPGLSPGICHHPQGRPRGHHSIGPQRVLYTNLALWLWGVHDTPGLSPCIYHHPQGRPRGHHSVGPQCVFDAEWIFDLVFIKLNEKSQIQLPYIHVYSQTSIPWITRDHGIKVHESDSLQFLCEYFEEKSENFHRILNNFSRN